MTDNPGVQLVLQIMIAVSGSLSTLILYLMFRDINKLKERDEQLFAIYAEHGARFEKVDAQIAQALKHVASIDEKLSWRIDRLEKEQDKMKDSIGRYSQGFESGK